MKPVPGSVSPHLVSLFGHFFNVIKSLWEEGVVGRPKEPMGADGAVQQLFPNLLWKFEHMEQDIMLQHFHTCLDGSLHHAATERDRTAVVAL